MNTERSSALLSKRYIEPILLKIEKNFQDPTDDELNGHEQYSVKSERYTLLYRPKQLDEFGW